jgi:MGT family glycosyltransferase
MYDFFLKCIEAFKDSEEYQVIVSVGKFVDIKKSFSYIPENFSIYNYVPQTQLLPEVDVFISHAGLNSTTESLSAGIPLILIPQKYDQFDVARTVQRLNAGLFLNKNEIEITPDVLRKAVQEAYDNRENYKKGINDIVESFREARKNRKAIYEEVFD